MPALHRLAEAAGLAVRWTDYQGQPHEVAAHILKTVLTALGYVCDDDDACRACIDRMSVERAAGRLPPMLVVQVGKPANVGTIADPARRAYSLRLETGGEVAGVARVVGDGDCRIDAIVEPGYHRLAINGQEVNLAVVPTRAFGVADLVGDRKLWGLTAQLYSLRSPGDAGIGSFSGLAALAREAGRHGAAALAVSPVHAPFLADVERCSPYSPSSRLFVNALHVDLAEVFGAEAVDAALVAEGMSAEAAALEALPLVDWPRAGRLRLRLARRLLANFETLPQQWREDCQRFIETGGKPLEHHARFEVLHAYFLQQSPPLWHWQQWPPAFRDPGSAEVAAFADRHASEVRFHLQLQWLADRGLGAAQAAAKGSGMAIGLISDLAVGADAGGSHGWSRPQDFLRGLSVGAPPDGLNARGQGWGLTAFSPRALVDEAYAPFLDLLRSQLRHAGGLRIDHVIGLGRLWLVPDGADPADGVYLKCPIEALFGLVALESWRHRAVIIGENLGTVPEGFDERLSQAGILGMGVLWFERDDTGFTEPESWQHDAAAMTTTHDLPTVAGWWSGRDIDWRAQLALYGEGQDEAADRRSRAEDRAALWQTFVAAGMARGAPPPADAFAAVIDAACAFVAATPAALTLVPIEDLLGLVEQPNLPGTTDGHPNWRRRLPVAVATLLDSGATAARVAALSTVRTP